MGHPTMQENDTAKLTPTNFLFPASGFQGINRPDIHILFADSLLFRRFW